MKPAFGLKREQQVLVGGILIAIVGVWVYVAWLLGPLFRSIHRLGEQIQTERTQLEQMQQAVAQELVLRQEYAKLSEAMTSFREILPPEENLPSMIELLSDLASQTGIKIQTIFPQRSFENRLEIPGLSASPSSSAAPQRIALYKEVPIQIDAVAGFHQLGSFLNRIEMSEQPMQLKSLRISENLKEPRRHNINVVLLIYFALEDTSSLEAVNPASAAGPGVPR